MERESIVKCVERGKQQQRETQEPESKQCQEQQKPKIILDYHDKLIAKMEELAKTRNVRPMQRFSC